MAVRIYTLSILHILAHISNKPRGFPTNYLSQFIKANLIIRNVTHMIEI